MSSASGQSDAVDDVATFRHHGGLEISALCNTILGDLRAVLMKSAREMHDSQQVDAALSGVESTLRREIESFIAFLVLLLERMAANAGAIDRVAIADRAALCAAFDRA